MSTVYFVDTSVLLNLLKVPNRSQQYEEIKKQYEERVKEGASFVFPTAALIETGNHIAQIKDGNLRRKTAKKFVDFISKAIDLKDNMSVVPEITLDELHRIIGHFPDHAAQNVGFGDISIIEQFNSYWEKKQPIGIASIWSTDKHLASYPPKEGGLNRRRNS